MRLTTLALSIIFLASSALAESFGHVYGGYTPVPKDETNAVVVGGGWEVGRGYLGLDFSALKPTDQLLTELGRELAGAGLEAGTVSLKASGMDFSFGAAAATGERFALIPVGIIGYSRYEVEGCIETFCDSDIYSEANFGGGMVARFMASERVGFHAAVRYTRNYGPAIIFGIAYRGN